MFTPEIPLAVLVTAPANYAGTYRSTKDPTSQTWSWYSEIDKDRMPHFTVGMHDDGQDGWYRFHVTLPIASGRAIANAHLFYIIKNKSVSRRREGFSNADELSSEPRKVLESILEKDGALIDELAYRFYYGAFRGAKSAAAIATAKQTGVDARGNPVSF